MKTTRTLRASGQIRNSVKPSRSPSLLIRTISTTQRTPASLATERVSSQHVPGPAPHTAPPQPPNFSKEFTFGAYQTTGTTPVTTVRYPKFQSLESERAFRKLHHAAALRWLGYQGYNNEGAGGHVTVRDPILPDHFWINPHGRSFSWMRPEDLVLMGPSKFITVSSCCCNFLRLGLFCLPWVWRWRHHRRARREHAQRQPGRMVHSLRRA